MYVSDSSYHDIMRFITIGDGMGWMRRHASNPDTGLPLSLHDGRTAVPVRRGCRMDLNEVLYEMGGLRETII